MSTVHVLVGKLDKLEEVTNDTSVRELLCFKMTQQQGEKKAMHALSPVAKGAQEVNTVGRGRDKKTRKGASFLA